MTDLLKHETVCNLCPQDKPFRVMTSAVPIVGEDPRKRVEAVFQELAKHLSKKHPEALQSLQLMAAQYMMFAGATYFRSSDTIITEAQNIARYRIRKSTERIILPDEKIVEKARSLEASDYGSRGVSPETDAILTSAVIAWVTEVRDALLEQGAFCPEPVPVSTNGNGSGI